MRAVCLMKIGQQERGEAEARTLLAERPPLNDVDVTLTLAEVLYERGDLRGALALADEAMAFAPRHPIPPYWRARVLLQQKQILAAAKSAEDSVRLAPQLPFAHDLLSRIYRLQGRTADAARETEWLRQFENQKAQGVRK
jgi:predicted Zn-dependent protease